MATPPIFQFQFTSAISTRFAISPDSISPCSAHRPWPESESVDSQNRGRGARDAERVTRRVDVDQFHRARRLRSMDGPDTDLAITRRRKADQIGPQMPRDRTRAWTQTEGRHRRKHRQRVRLRESAQFAQWRVLGRVGKHFLSECHMLSWSPTSTPSPATPAYY